MRKEASAFLQKVYHNLMILGAIFLPWYKYNYLHIYIYPEKQILFLKNDYYYIKQQYH